MTNLFKDFPRLCALESQIQAQDFTLKAENAALKEQVAYLEELNRKLCDKANQLTIMDARAGETIAQQAEAIRLKDEALLNLLSVIDSEAYPTIQNNGYDAVARQPSPEILQARDKRVAEACAKVCIEQSEGIARSTPVSRDRVHTMFKGTARPAPVRDCSESSVRESAFRIRNGAWERHL